LIHPVGVSGHVLLTGFRTGWLSLLADGSIGFVALGYLLGVWRLRQKGRRWPFWNTASFECGIVVVFISLCSGLAAYDDDNFSAHVVQHVLIMMVAPPLLVLGRPLGLLIQSANRSVQVRTIAVLRSGALRLAASLGSGLAYYAVMWAYFLTPWYGASARSSVLHEVTHGVFFLVGLCYWQALLGFEHVGRRPSRVLRVAAILAGMPVEMYLGFLLHSFPGAIGPGTTAASTRAGGEVFWWLTMLVSGLALGLALAQWVFEDERAAARKDATAEEAEWTYPRSESGSGQAGISRGLPAPAK
jgi:cytochrome c oxidase assembly factor CtaG